jgi:hypothetical protein
MDASRLVRDGLDLDEQVRMRQLAHGHRRPGRARLGEELRIHLVVGGEVGHVDEVRRDLDEVGQAGAGSGEDVADVLDDLELVTLNNPYIETCDMFTGSPPQGVLAQGELTITWLGSGELSDGDDFTWAFENCWSQDDGEMLDGTVTLEDYTESVDFNTGVLFNIGFGGLGAGAPGGVIFDLTFSETVEDQGVWTIPADGVIIVSGGFVLNIQQP